MVIWITGLSGSGKTTIATRVYKFMKDEHKNIILLDGDVIRNTLNSNYGYSNGERLKAARQIHLLCKMLSNEGLVVVCATISLFHEIQDLNRNNIKNYIEVYLNVSLDKLIQRDPKGLYKKALNKKIDNVVGVDLTYEAPINPDIEINNSKIEDLDSNIDKIINLVYQNYKM